MAFTTTSSKRVLCPLWKEEIYLHGNYLLSEESGHQYEAKFLSATCPIVENLKLPSQKRNKDFELFRFCDQNPCEAMRSFKPVINIQHGGYSQ